MTAPAIFCSPGRYTQGDGATRLLGQEMAFVGLSGPALLIASRTASGLLENTWRDSLGHAGIEYLVQIFNGECSSREIDHNSLEAQRIGARTVIGAGGGKVLDTARAVADDLGVPVVICPTIASTAAPCSALSVIYAPDGRVEKLRFFGRNPELVLVDTGVIARAPARFLVAGMGDALATYFEARTCVEARRANLRGGLSTQAAYALALLSYETLLEHGLEALVAAKRHEVTPELEQIIEANTLLSGLGFESSGLAAARSIHNGLAVAPATRPFLHGEKVAFGVLVQLCLEKRPHRERKNVIDFCTTVGLPTTLAQLGLAEVSPEMLHQIAERATAAAEPIHNEPFAVDAEMVVDAIIAADEMGRDWQHQTIGPARHAPPRE